MTINQPEIKIKDFEIDSVLGFGGTSIVYSAVKNNERFALKIYRRFGPNGKLPESKFFQNHKIAYSFDHPNIRKVISIGKWNDRGYIVLEYIDGIDIKKWTQIHEESHKKNLTLYIFQIASSLCYLESIGYLHGDIRSQNILISQDQAFLIDFDTLQPIHAATTTTSSYLAPDLLRGRKREISDEIVSFGLMLQGLTAGRDFYKQFNFLLKKCLDKNPKKRFQSFTEIVEFLDAY